MDVNLLLLAVIGLFYPLLVLESWKRDRRKSKAGPINSEIMEIDFALREGYTIIGVLDMGNKMNFYIDNNSLDEKKL
jgi:hypothetical protein